MSKRHTAKKDELTLPGSRYRVHDGCGGKLLLPDGALHGFIISPEMAIALELERIANALEKSTADPADPHSRGTWTHDRAGQVVSPINQTIRCLMCGADFVVLNGDHFVVKCPVCR
jgi:hypothetical protein